MIGVGYIAFCGLWAMCFEVPLESCEALLYALRNELKLVKVGGGLGIGGLKGGVVMSICWSSGDRLATPDFIA